MTTKNQIFTSVLSGSPLITSEKLIGSENYLSWSASVELWFMGQGYEDHLVTQEANIPEVDRVQWRKIDAQLCSVLWAIGLILGFFFIFRPIKLVLNFGLRPKDYTRMISSVSIRWLLLLSISANRTWIYLLILVRIASLKEQFLTVMPLTPDVGAQQTQLDKFFMVLTLIGLRPDLEPIRDQILGSSSVPSLDDVFARLLRLSSTQTLPSASASDFFCVSFSHYLSRRTQCYMEDLLALPIWPSLLILRCLSLRAPLHLRHLRLLFASVAQPGNASVCLTHTSSLGSWILDSGASDHLSGPEYGEDDCIRT
ncbi:hypothetical protein CK203_040151 [Vitis vinifera]|uniref:Uncharacterized protein n=1 Tax=Vitis vinifera TaxID=29760 RepID=A0A438H3H7_VITVI|nr:hypothetical protein CK203_040151 [Vitis vinifera]